MTAEHGDLADIKGNEARRGRDGPLIDDHLAAGPSEDDATFAIQHGLIEG